MATIWKRTSNFCLISIFPSLATLFVTIVYYYYVRFTSVHFEITTNGMRLVGPSYAIFLIKALVPFELAVMAVMLIGYPLSCVSFINISTNTIRNILQTWFSNMNVLRKFSGLQFPYCLLSAIVYCL